MLLCVNFRPRGAYLWMNHPILGQMDQPWHIRAPDLRKNILTTEYSTTHHAGVMSSLLNSYKTLPEGF